MVSSELLGQLDWFKASYSNGAGGECLECAIAPKGSVLIRDSKCSNSDVLAFGPQAWTNFLREANSGPQAAG
ncbi:DUF397 domain-containing protein [Streptomyces sp. NBC_01016]|uniref:DUF397 domain-containing protein n=1 Tax=Streptomyces sp. NBC_01016 TaxID=2903720 RepID=UPI002251586D|nr:DUF397 domain-containing protein [Streptomyces sp. NBC_01016]MCX4827273.1 DUF397 domain-containing protein [Streptomyces sp. NBC_01016]